jgi:NitT/TauT family transport system permease protein
MSVKRSRFQLILNYLPAVLVLIVTFIFWEVAVASFSIPSFILPPPSGIINELMGTRVDWISHIIVTLYETLVGFALAFVLGVVTAYLIVHYKVLANIIYPYILAAQIVPKVAVAPLLYIWLGFGELPKILLAFLLAFFPIVIDTVVGLRSTDPDLLDLAKLLKAKPTQVFIHINLPSALPSIFGGMKVGMTLAIIGAIIGEFVGANRGLGFMIVLAQQHFTTTIIFASLLLLIILGILLYLVIEFAELVTMPWYRKLKRLA